MKKVALLLIFTNSLALGQDFIKRINEQGYKKEGVKVGVWKYFYKKGHELSIDHETGVVSFVINDTSKYVIYKNGAWISEVLDQQPIPSEGTYNFFKELKNLITYPDKDFYNGIQGKQTVLFEIDTAGYIVNQRIVKSISQACDSTILNALYRVNQKWVPAKNKGTKYASRFTLSVSFLLNRKENSFEKEHHLFDSLIGKSLPEDIIVVHHSTLVHNFVEQQAEFPGGQEALAIWLAKNLKYPPSASRMGQEGKVYVKFIVETDGSITNPEILRGFDGACDREALRVVKIMPKWVPGKQRGRAVRSYFTQVVYFRVENWKR